MTTSNWFFSCSKVCAIVRKINPYCILIGEQIIVDDCNSYWAAFLNICMISFTLNKILFKHMCAISRNHRVSPWRGVGGLCQGAGQPGQAGASHPGRCREPVILPEKWGLNRKNVDFIWIKRGLNGHLMGNGDLTWTTWECKQQYPRGCVWKWEIFPAIFAWRKRWSAIKILGHSIFRPTCLILISVKKWKKRPKMFLRARGVNKLMFLSWYFQVNTLRRHMD